jgi:DNA-binding CsgD family transcriptional regulator
MANAKIKARDGRGRAIRAVETVEQDKRAAELRSASLTLDQIAAELGVSRRTAGRAVLRGLRAIGTDSEDLAAAKVAELLKLDRRERKLWTEYGKDLTPEQLATLNGAFDRVAKRRADLLGLDEPTRSRVEVITDDIIAEATRCLDQERAVLEAQDRDDTSDHSETRDGPNVPGGPPPSR